MYLWRELLCNLWWWPLNLLRSWLVCTLVWNPSWFHGLPGYTDLSLLNHLLGEWFSYLISYNWSVLLQSTQRKLVWWQPVAELQGMPGMHRQFRVEIEYIYVFYIKKEKKTLICDFASERHRESASERWASGPRGPCSQQPSDLDSQYANTHRFMLYCRRRSLRIEELEAHRFDNIYVFYIKKRKKTLICDFASERHRESASERWASGPRGPCSQQPSDLDSQYANTHRFMLYCRRRSLRIEELEAHRFDNSTSSLRRFALPYADANTDRSLVHAVSVSAIGCRPPIVVQSSSSSWSHDLGEFFIWFFVLLLFKKFMCTLIAHCLALK
jgi:hypothetical protein